MAPGMMSIVYTASLVLMMVLFVIGLATPNWIDANVGSNVTQGNFASMGPVYRCVTNGTCDIWGKLFGDRCVHVLHSIVHYLCILHIALGKS